MFHFSPSPRRRTRRHFARDCSAGSATSPPPSLLRSRRRAAPAGRPSSPCSTWSPSTATMIRTANVTFLTKTIACDDRFIGDSRANPNPAIHCNCIFASGMKGNGNGQWPTCFLSPAVLVGVSKEEAPLQLRGRCCVCEVGDVGVTGLTSAFQTTSFISIFLLINRHFRFYSLWGNVKIEK